MTEDITLLTAVDALTRPNILTRYTGVGHDHEWQPLKRPLTLEEKAEFVAGKKRPPASIDTGEWWCQWCTTTVTDKPSTEHTEQINRRDDPPLLDQLQTAIASNIGGTGTGKEAHTRTPFDVGALTLYGAIDERVRAWILDLGGETGKGLSLVQLVRAWFVLRQAAVRPEGEDVRFVEILSGWRTAIMDILDPPTQIPYIGQSCPVCDSSRARVVVAGDVEDTVALWAFLRPAYRAEGSYGLCKACKTVLAQSDDPLQLRAMMNGVIRPVGRLTQTVAEAV